jgi:hypothetical protein
MALSTITAALYARACFCWYASAHGDALVSSTRRSPPRRRRTRHPGDRQGRRSCPKGDPRAQPARYRRARAFSMAASRDETPIPNQQRSRMEPGYPILDTTPMALTGCAFSPPEGHQVMLQAYFQKTSRPRCGLFGRALSRVIDRATFCLFCPAAGTVAEASTTPTRISCSTFSRSSNTVVSRSSG